MTTTSPVPKQPPSGASKAVKKAAPTPTMPNKGKSPVGPVPGQDLLAQILALKQFASAAVPGILPGLSDEELVIFVASRTEHEGFTAMNVDLTYFGVKIAQAGLVQKEKGGIIQWTL